MRKIFFASLLLLASLLKAQSTSRLGKNFNSNDSTTLITVATYPDSVRRHVLVACQKPEVLLKTEALQKSTSKSFRDLVYDHSKEEQKKFWELARYPGLLPKMTSGGKRSKDELEAIAAAYPEEIRNTVVLYGRKHYDKLTEINQLHENSQKEFEKIIADYPAQTQSAYRSLVKHPDVLNTLAGNMHFSVMLGDMHRSDPKYVNNLLDSVKTEHDKQSAKDLEEWKAGLEKNPEAKKEMEEAAKEFERERVDEDYYDTDDVYYTGPAKKNTIQVYTTPPTITYVVHPYPYWFGYPWWYDYPYWYPYPYWYNAGFYWGPGGMVFVGFPSPFFMHWYFFHPYHHYYYAHFSDYCVGYSYPNYGPRNRRTGFNSEIHKWRKANEPNLPKGYLNADAQRPSRIKELGKFEMDYHNNTKGVFGKNISRPEFLKNNRDYYPHLNPALNKPGLNKRIEYPQQQNPQKFNMGQPRRNSDPVQPGKGGFAPPKQIQKGGAVGRPHK